MNAIVFDTHEAAKAFEGAGFTKEQVEVLVDNARRTTSLPDISLLATRADLHELRAEIEKAKVQAITIILSAMAAMTVIGSLIGKLIR